MEQQLAHLIARTPVGGIRRLFFGKQFGIFLLQALDGGELFHAQIVKGFLRRLVQKDVALMLREILFRVARLAVSGVNIAGLGVVDDMCFQHGDLRHAPLRRLDLCRERAELFRGSGGFFFQFRVIQQPMLPKIIVGLRHLLDVEYLCPALVAHALSGLQLRLDVDEQRVLFLRGLTALFARRMLLFPGKDSAQLIFRIAVDGGKTDKALFAGVTQGQRIPAPPDLASAVAQQLQKRVKAVRLLQKRRVDEAAEQFPVGGLRLASQPPAVVVDAALRVCDHGEPVLGADGVAEPCHRPAGAEKIAELMLAVQRGGVPDDVIVNMPLVGMGSYKKGVSSFQKPLGKFIAHTVCVLRRDLTGLEGLAHLIGDHVVPLLPPGDGLVLPLGEQKLRVGGFWVAFVCGDQLAALCLVWILGVVDAVCQAVGNRLAVTDVHGNDACGRHGTRPPFGGMDL